MKGRRIAVALWIGVAGALASACGGAPAPGAAGADAVSAARHAALRGGLQAALDSLRLRGGFPGATAAVALPDGAVVEVASGVADRATGEPLRPGDRMLAGSVGKTFFAALALDLVREGRLDLDAPVSRYLGDLPWFGRLPNAADVTVRMLMRHTSGLVRYEFDPRVAELLAAEPDKVWTPAERVSYILDTAAPFAAGEGWEYSDTNYIVLGMILQRLAGDDLYDAIRRRYLAPLGLAGTIPSDRRELPGVVQGHAGPQNPFGGFETMIGADGRFVINPQMEWAGGGYASTAGDLARWARLLYGGRVHDDATLAAMLETVPAPMLGAGAAYGLGVIVRDTPLGRARGHSGFFPGYITEMAYFPDLDVGVAIQYNTSVGRELGGAPMAFLLRAAGLAAGREARP